MLRFHNNYMRENQASIVDFFQDLRYQQLTPIISKLPFYFQNYNPTLFWCQLQAFITQESIPKKVGLDLLIKLLNEEEIRLITNTNYEFLLRGEKIKEEYRKKFINNKYDEGLKIKLLTFIEFMKIRHLPEHLILHNQLIEHTYLSLETLLNHVGNQSLKIQITEIILSLRESNRQPFDVEKYLSNYQLQLILDIVMPINVAELEMHHDTEGQGYLSKIKEGSYVVQNNGQTGIGKSTITLFCLGYDLKKEIDHQGIIQLMPTTMVKEEHNCIASKASSHSETSSIHLVQPNNNFGIANLLFADKPGSDDTRGLTRQFYNLYLDRQLYSHCNKMIFIEIVDIKQLTEKLNKLKEFTSKIAKKYEYQTTEDIRQFLVIIFNKCNSNLQQLSYLASVLDQALTLQDFANGKERTVLRYLQQQLRQNVFTVDFYSYQGKRQSFFSYLNEKSFKNPRQVVTDTMKQEIKKGLLCTLDNFSYYLTQDFANNQQIIAFYYKQCCKLLNFIRLFPRIEQEPSMKKLTRQMNSIIQKFITSKQQIQKRLDKIKSSIGTILKDKNQQRVNQTIPQQTNENLSLLKFYSSIFGSKFSQEQELCTIKLLVEQQIGNLQTMLNGRLTYSQADLTKYKENLNKYLKISQIKEMFPQFSTQCLHYIDASHKHFDKIFNSIFCKLYNTSRFQRFITVISEDKDGYLQFLSFASSILLLKKIDYVKKNEKQLQNLNHIITNCCKVLSSKISFKDQQIPQLRRESQLSIEELEMLLVFIDDLKKIDYFNRLPQFQQLCEQFPQKLKEQIKKLKEALSRHVKQHSEHQFEQSIQILQKLQNLIILTNNQSKRREIEQLFARVRKLAQEGRIFFDQISETSLLKSTYGFLLRLFNIKK